MSRRVGVLVGLLAVVGVGGGWVAFGARFGGHKSAFHLEKARVERGDVVGRVTATGTLSALVTVQVGSQVSGRIAELYADFGQRVNEGQVIARLDPQLFAGGGGAGARQPGRRGRRRCDEGAHQGRGRRAAAGAHAGADAEEPDRRRRLDTADLQGRRRRAAAVDAGARRTSSRRAPPTTRPR